MSMADQIYELVSSRRTVSFAELSRSIKGFSGGDLQIVLSGDKWSNIVMWSGLTQAAVDALEELRVAKKIHPIPSSRLVYFIDGCVLNMPIAKSKRHYRKPHWAPVVFNPGPDPKSETVPMAQKRGIETPTESDDLVPDRLVCDEACRAKDQ